MTTDYEKIATLFHYCFEFCDLLRPILNTKQYDKIDHKFMDQKLKEFYILIDDCLEAETLKPSPKENFYVGDNNDKV